MVRSVGTRIRVLVVRQGWQAVRRTKPTPRPSWPTVGDVVDYCAVIGEPPTMFGLTVESGPGQLASGHWVVWLGNKPGCVSVDACARPAVPVALDTQCRLQADDVRCSGRPIDDQHRTQSHPDFEYATTTGPRKAFHDEDRPPHGDGWERNRTAGRDGWERFVYHEEAYWMRRKP